MPLKDKEALKLYNRKYKRDNSDRVHEYHLKSMYGLSMEEYNKMFDNQNGCCWICSTHQQDLKHRLFVDHCHDTGQVRGLLCRSCNTGLGNFNDDPSLLKIATEYLDQKKE